MTVLGSFHDYMKKVLRTTTQTGMENWTKLTVMKLY